MDHEVARTLGELEGKLRELERELAELGRQTAEPPDEQPPATVGRLVDEAVEPPRRPLEPSTPPLEPSTPPFESSTPPLESSTPPLEPPAPPHRPLGPPADAPPLAATPTRFEATSPFAAPASVEPSVGQAPAFAATPSRYSMEAQETAFGEIPATRDEHETIDLAELVRFRDRLQHTLGELIDEYNRLLSLGPRR